MRLPDLKSVSQRDLQTGPSEVTGTFRLAAISPKPPIPWSNRFIGAFVV